MLNRASILARVAPFRGAIMAALGLPYVVRNDEMIGRSIRNRPGSDGRTALSVRASRSVLVADDRHRRFRAPSRAAADDLALVNDRLVASCSCRSRGPISLVVLCK